MEILRLLVVSLTLAILSGCGRQHDADYFWGQDVGRKTFSVKVIVPLAGTMEGTLIARQDGTIKIGGKTYYKIVTTIDGIPGATSETSYSRLGEDGIYSRKTTDTLRVDTLEVPFPAEVGRKWSYKRDDLQMEMAIAAIEDLDTVEKTYRRCLKVVGKGHKGTENIEMTTYYAPKVGVLRMAMTGPNGLMEMKLHPK